MKCVISDTATFRRAIEEMAELLSALPERVRFDSRLVASELITNALKYGGGKAYFSCEKEEDGVLICVRGEKEFEPPRLSVCPEATAERGRGLFLVDTFSVRREYSKEAGLSVVIRFAP